MSDLKQEQVKYIAQLKEKGIKVATFKCPICKKENETLSNDSGRDWDALSQCTHCDSHYIKFTLANHGGVKTKVLALTE